MLLLSLFSKFSRLNDVGASVVNGVSGNLFEGNVFSNCGVSLRVR